MALPREQIEELRKLKAQSEDAMARYSAAVEIHSEPPNWPAARDAYEAFESALRNSASELLDAAEERDRFFHENARLEGLCEAQDKAIIAVTDLRQRTDTAEHRCELLEDANRKIGAQLLEHTELCNRLAEGHAALRKLLHSASRYLYEVDTRDFRSDDHFMLQAVQGDVRAALSAPRPYAGRATPAPLEYEDTPGPTQPQQDPVGWRYRVLVNKHSTGAVMPEEISMLDISRTKVWGIPGQWRYSDGPNKPDVDWMCESEPLYASGATRPSEGESA